MCFLVLKTLDLRGLDMAAGIIRVLLDADDYLRLCLEPKYFNKLVDPVTADPRLMK